MFPFCQRLTLRLRLERAAAAVGAIACPSAGAVQEIALQSDRAELCAARTNAIVRSRTGAAVRGTMRRRAAAATVACRAAPTPAR
jgi:hypothetical protein